MNPQLKNDSYYPSKVDWWIAVATFAGPVVLIIAGFFSLATNRTDAFIDFGIAAVVILFIFLVCIPCRYRLTDSSLLIQHGIITKRIDLTRIRSARLSSDPLSAPAMSLQRIAIGLDRGICLISPIDREAFIKDLENRISRIRS